MPLIGSPFLNSLTNIGAKFGASLGTLNSSSPSVGFINSETSNNSAFMDYLQGLVSTQGQEAAENRLFNAQEAEKNRQWQEYMSNTSYQRAVSDLQKAGLNPILAYSQGGATTPSGGSASISSLGGDTLSSIINSFANLISSTSGVADLLKIFSKLKGG